jgi:hypothetical protein
VGSVNVEFPEISVQAPETTLNGSVTFATALSVKSLTTIGFDPIASLGETVIVQLVVVPLPMVQLLDDGVPPVTGVVNARLR